MAMEKVAFVIRGNSCFIVPGHIVLDKGDQIRFSVNGKCNSVTLMFPDGSIFSQSSPYIVTLTRGAAGAPGTQNQTLHVNQNAQEGVYPFTAYCHDTGSLAIGGSDGEIIIQT